MIHALRETDRIRSSAAGSWPVLHVFGDASGSGKVRPAAANPVAGTVVAEALNPQRRRSSFD